MAPECDVRPIPFACEVTVGIPPEAIVAQSLARWPAFQARLDWCVKPFANPNQPPVVHVRGEPGSHHGQGRRVASSSITCGVTQMRIVIRKETSADHSAIREVNRLAFDRDDEACLVDALRDGGYVRASLVAEVDGDVVGHILFTELPIDTEDGIVEALALAPMAVVPSHQRHGIGSMLVQDGLRACAEAGHRIVVVLGHPEFYPRFGFSAKRAEPLKSPFAGEAFMALELVPGALDGVEGKVRYPPPFGLG